MASPLSFPLDYLFERLLFSLMFFTYMQGLSLPAFLQIPEILPYSLKSPFKTLMDPEENVQLRPPLFLAAPCISTYFSSLNCLNRHIWWVAQCHSGAGLNCEKRSKKRPALVFSTVECSQIPPPPPAVRTCEDSSIESGSCHLDSCFRSDQCAVCSLVQKGVLLEQSNVVHLTTLFLSYILNEQMLEFWMEKSVISSNIETGP